MELRHVLPMLVEKGCERIVKCIILKIEPIGFPLTMQIAGDYKNAISDFDFMIILKTEENIHFSCFQKIVKTSLIPKNI